MLIEAEDETIAQLLHETKQTIVEGGGYVAADLIVRESGGEFSCAIREDPGRPGRILLDYDEDLRAPIHLLDWDSTDDRLVVRCGLDAFSDTQRRLLELWVEMVNNAGKLHRIRSTVPRFAVTDWTLRHQLADAGYPSLREPPTDADLRDTLLGWHGMGDGRDEHGRVRWLLIPLKNLVNHHPLGAGQSPLPGRVALATSSVSDATGTYENYGDLDAMQLLMHFGYVEPGAPVVHSVPVQVQSPDVGSIVVRWRAPRGSASSGEPAAEFSKTSDGIRIRHVSFRPGNRELVARRLAATLRESRGLTASAAAAAAEHSLDAILQANLDYYRRLDTLVMQAHRSAGSHADIAEVSMIQQQHLRRWC